MIKSALTALALVGASTSAFAAADLEVDLVAPVNPLVYATARYTVDVSNVGNRTASSVTVTVDLPVTQTSPQVHLMGTLGAIDGACSQVGFSLECSLGRIRKGDSAAIWFDLALPASAAPLEIRVEAATTSSENTLGNNSLTHVATLSAYSTPIAAPVDIVNRHCTGQGLSAFFECETAPSSISSHSAAYAANGTLTITDPPGSGVIGTWSQPTSDTLEFTYEANSVIQAEFYGIGVGGGCFEGLTTFPNSPWVAPYEVCIQ